jgi:hypothetical protein
MHAAYIWMWACAGASAVAAPLVNAAAEIYRCEIAGVATYEDRPCSANAARYVPDAARINTYAPPPVRSDAPPGSHKPRRRGAPRASIAAEQRKHAEECRRIEDSLRDIQSKMRSGYNAKEGERLRARKAKLAERRRAHKCG